MTETTKQKRTYKKRSDREKESVAGIIALVKRVEELEEENSILRKAVEEEHQRANKAEAFMRENEKDLLKEQNRLNDTIMLLKATQNIPANIEGIIYELVRARLAFWSKKIEDKNLNAKQELEIDWYPFREVFPKLEQA